MNAEQLIDAIRQEFTKELESTGAYNKAGMSLAFERAVARAVLRFVRADRLDASV